MRHFLTEERRNTLSTKKSLRKSVTLAFLVQFLLESYMRHVLPKVPNFRTNLRLLSRIKDDRHSWCWLLSFLIHRDKVNCKGIVVTLLCSQSQCFTYGLNCGIYFNVLGPFFCSSFHDKIGWAQDIYGINLRIIMNEVFICWLRIPPTIKNLFMANRSILASDQINRKFGRCVRLVCMVLYNAVVVIIAVYEY
jgi:hypothetical protein